MNCNNCGQLITEKNKWIVWKGRKYYLRCPEMRAMPKLEYRGRRKSWSSAHVAEKTAKK